MPIALILLGLWLPIACSELAPDDSDAIVDAVGGRISRFGPVQGPPDGQAFEKLESYRLFTLQDGKPVVNDQVVEYDLVTPLFTDYALKTRMIWVPDGAAAAFTTVGAFDFPIGTIVAKVFAYPADFREPDRAIRVIETRLLIHHRTGWQAYPYVWNAEQNSAVLARLGAEIDVSFVKADATPVTTRYVVPNVNQCLECHGNLDPVSGEKTMGLIGPKAKHINREYSYADGAEQILARLGRLGLITGVPDDLETIPTLARWDDPAAPITDRARAYLDANCAHCHNPAGSGAGSGLMLRSEDAEFGLCGTLQRSVAGATHEIVPGDPDRSAVFRRMATREPREMMPRLGRSLVHTEGVALVREWIAGMDPTGHSCAAVDPE